MKSILSNHNLKNSDTVLSPLGLINVFLIGIDQACIVCLQLIQNALKPFPKKYWLTVNPGLTKFSIIMLLISKNNYHCFELRLPFQAFFHLTTWQLMYCKTMSFTMHQLTFCLRTAQSHYLKSHYVHCTKKLGK